MAGVRGGSGYSDEESLEWSDGDPPEWSEADEDRYQLRRQEDLRRRRRRRRQGWSFAAVVLLVLGAGVAGAGIFQGWWEWPFQGEASTVAESPRPCPVPSVSAAAPAEVRVVVLNATGTKGLAASVGTELTARGYVVEAVGNDETGVDVAETAQVRHGPEQLPAAQSLAIQFPGAVLVDDGRGGDVVEVAVGLAYSAMTPAAEATARLAPAPVESPAGCVPPTPAG